MTGRTETGLLHALARRHGIQTAYGDVRGQRAFATVDTLRALLGALGVPAGSPAECADSWREAELSQSARLAEEVVVAWDGVLRELELGGAAPSGEAAPDVYLVLEDGSEVRVDVTPLQRAPGSAAGRVRPARRYQLHPEVALPPGYHTLVCRHAGRESTSLLLSAPTRCYNGEQAGGGSWGLFAPLYALRGDADFGAGSYTELRELACGTARVGGDLVGTLPLLPCYFEPGREPSPYLPVSRLLWSEFYIDVAHLPRAEWTAVAAQVLSDATVAEQRAALRRSSRVDYVQTRLLKETVLRHVFDRVSAQDAFRASLESFCLAHPHAAGYAAFRATRDGLGRPWREWSDRAGAGAPDVGRRADGGVHFRAFQQWLAHEQMTECVARAAADGVGLYLDLPVGVHPEGYDAWRYGDAFVAGVSTGAPPDIVFTTGQKWGSPPIHPAAIRRRHYDYVRQYLSHHMQVARTLRIDHVMGLHRIFCIPEGAEAAAGAYLRYRPEEWYAILSIESHRHRTVLVGEDLGLVPGEVRRSMSRHGLHRMFVLYYELDGIAAGRPPALPRRCLASLNTHDMPTFASMWQGLDIGQHTDVGIVKPCEAPALMRSRVKAIQALARLLRTVCPEVNDDQCLEDMLRCTLRWLGATRARYVVVSIEDLWQETVQQNIPGVGEAYPSWRHRMTMTLADAWRSRPVQATLAALRHARRAGR